MIEKEYYRLDDLKHRFDLTESDVHYLIAEKNVPPCFYIPRALFIIGGWQNSDFIGYAKVDYEGLVSIPQHYIKDLINRRKAIPNFFKLLNKAKIRQIDTKYDCALPLPNNYIQGWKAICLSDISWQEIPAKLYPKITQTLKHTYKELLISLASDETAKAVTAEKLNRSFGEIQKEELKPIYRTFLFSEVCIRHEDLVSYGIIKTNDSSPTKLPIGTKNQKLDNEFEDLLAAIVLSSPKKLTAKKIHRILCEECLREEDQRLFDLNNILLGEDQGVISWRDKYRNNKERTYMQTTLNTVISRVRKKINI